jgi:hypothetical protein
MPVDLFGTTAYAYSIQHTFRGPSNKAGQKRISKKLSPLGYLYHLRGCSWASWHALTESGGVFSIMKFVFSSDVVELMICSPLCLLYCMEFCASCTKQRPLSANRVQLPSPKHRQLMNYPTSTREKEDFGINLPDLGQYLRAIRMPSRGTGANCRLRIPTTCLLTMSTLGDDDRR